MLNASHAMNSAGLPPGGPIRLADPACGRLFVERDADLVADLGPEAPTACH
jgi:hypothetical protein